MLVVVNLDPEHAHEATLLVDLAVARLHCRRAFVAYDELTGDATYPWPDRDA